MKGNYDDTLNLARNTTNNRLFLAIFFSFLTVAGSGSVAYGDLLDAPRVADLPWGRVGARQAAKAIESGQTSIKVASRDDAAEVVWRMYSSRGFTNTTGRTGNDVHKILGSKASTYHWDEVLDEAGNLSGHGAGNIHGAMRHVQIHLVDKTIIRIFFP